jgi:hypothetical protein
MAKATDNFCRHNDAPGFVQEIALAGRWTDVLPVAFALRQAFRRASGIDSTQLPSGYNFSAASASRWRMMLLRLRGSTGRPAAVRRFQCSFQDC